MSASGESSTSTEMSTNVSTGESLPSSPSLSTSCSKTSLSDGSELDCLHPGSYRLWFRHTGMEQVEWYDIDSQTTSIYTREEMRQAVGDHHVTQLKVEGDLPSDITEWAPLVEHLCVKKLSNKQSLDSLSNLQLLNRLYISRKPLHTVPDVISEMRSLSELDMRWCQLSTIPDSLSNLQILNRLSISFNPLHTVPDVISEMRSLSVLQMYRCELSTIPDSLSNLQLLNRLDISLNPLHTVPDVISEMRSLSVLQMASCELSTIPNSLSNLQLLNTLNISENPLHTVPDVISEMRSLSELRMYRCELSTIPDSLSNLQLLNTLNISENPLHTVPDVISEMRSLSELWMYSCELSTVPNSLSNLQLLNRLDISENPLHTVPDVISEMRSLSVLEMQSCGLSTIPDSLFNLEALEELRIGGNLITHLPDSIARLKSLKELSLRKSKQLVSLTSAILNMPCLNEIDCRECDSLTSPPRATCVQGYEAIVRHYKDIESKGKVKVSEACIAVIGRSMSGKTSLIRTLKRMDGVRDLTERDENVDESTKVFNIERLSVGADTLNFVDFGGQEIYQSTYQFALKDNCIPVVVVSVDDYQRLVTDVNGNEAVRLTYFHWLSHLYLANPQLKAPKLVVTHKDLIEENDFEELMDDFFMYTGIVYNMMRKEQNKRQKDSGCFSAIEHFKRTELFNKHDIYYVGNEYSEEFDKIRRDLIRESQSVVMEVPALWKEVESRVNCSESGYQPFEHLLSEITESELTDKEGLEIMLKYFHNSGKILWYGDKPELRSHVFDQISVVTDLLQVLFTHDEEIWNERRLSLSVEDNAKLSKDEFDPMSHTFWNSGVMDWKLLEHLLASETIFTADSQLELAVNVLKSFQLMYETNRNGRAFVIPYFSPKFLAIKVSSHERPILLRIDIKFDGLPLPHYVFHQTAVRLVEAQPENSDKIARNNGTEVTTGNYVLQLVHDYKTQKLTICVASDSHQICEAWKQLKYATNSTISYISDTWKASKIICSLACGPCQILKKNCPHKEVNPSWCKLPGRKESSHLSVANAKLSKCKENQNAPACLKYPHDHISVMEREALVDHVRSKVVVHEDAGARNDAPVEEPMIQSDDDVDSELSEGEDINARPAAYMNTDVVHTTKQRIKNLFLNTGKVYQMTPTRGRALIINNSYYPGVDYRQGSEYDVTNMLSMLRKFGFEVEVERNLTAEGVKSAIQEETKYNQREETPDQESDEEDYEEYGVFMLCIMAHGGENGIIYGTDMEKVKMTDVYRLLDSTNYPDMAGKPKIVIVQACREGERETSPPAKKAKLETERQSEQNVTPLQNRQQELERATGRRLLDVDDLLILHSCFEGGVSMRITDIGTLFIRTLVSTMCKHACHRDLSKIFRIVQQKVRNKSEQLRLANSETYFRQTPFVIKTLTGRRKLFLFPGWNPTT